MRVPVSLLIASLLTTPTWAGETAWQEVAPGVSLRLISTGQVKAGGKTLVGIEIDMPQTTKTYWRVPGDTGMPLQLDITSPSVSEHEVLWPYPTRDEGEAYLDYVYFGPTVLPVELSVTGDAPVVDLDLVLGVCSDICIPAQASFSLPLSEASPDRPNGLRLRQALAEVPMPWEGKTQPIGDVQYRPGAAVIEVEVTDRDLDPSTLIASMPSGEPVFGTPQKSPEPNLVLIPILGKAEPDLAGQAVQLTFVTDMGAFEVTRTIGAASD